MTDFVLLGLFLLALTFNKNMLPAVVAYFLCIVYQYTLFDSHSAVVNHVVYGVIFIPMIKYSSIKLAIGMLFYSVFHGVIGLDYFLFADVDTFVSNNYNFMQIALAISLIYSGSIRAHNDKSELGKHSSSDNIGGFNLWHIQTFTETRKGR